MKEAAATDEGPGPDCLRYVRISRFASLTTFLPKPKKLMARFSESKASESLSRLSTVRPNYQDFWGVPVDELRYRTAATNGFRCGAGGVASTSGRDEAEVWRRTLVSKSSRVADYRYVIMLRCKEGESEREREDQLICDRSCVRVTVIVQRLHL